MCLLGCDIGSSSIKVSVVDEETGLTIGSDFYPKEEAPIKASRPGWAEQDPESWWTYTKDAIRGALRAADVRGGDLVLMHPTKETAAALPSVLQHYKDSGLEPVPVSVNIGGAVLG